MYTLDIGRVRKRAVFTISEKDTTVIPTWWTDSYRHDENRKSVYAVALAYDYNPSPTFSLINKSQPTGGVKCRPWLEQPRVTTRRQETDIHRRHLQNMHFTVKKSARGTIWPITSVTLVFKYIRFLLRKAYVFLTFIVKASFSEEYLM